MADKYAAEDVAKALTDTKGMVTLAARQLQCSVNTVYRYIREYKSVADAQRLATEQMLDAVELALYDEAVNKRTTAALIFLAKTKGKSRGYVERMETVSLSVDTDLLKRAIDALESAGLDASAVFNDLIAEAAAVKQDAGAADAGAAAERA